MIPLLLALAGGCLLDAPYKSPLGTVPEDLGDGWAVGTPESVGIDPGVLAQIHIELLREDAHFGTLGLLVAKDGVLVFETWLRDPADRDHVHSLQSATKNFTSVATGLAWDRGLVPDLDRPLCDVLGDACADHPDKQGITLRHLLTMRSGVDLDNDHMAYDMLVEQPDDPLDYLLSQPMYAQPGEYFYRDTDPQLMAYALHALTGRSEAELLAEDLFAPLGIVDWYWEELPDGETAGPWGLHLRPRDFAKFGQMALDGGTWHGERVVSEAWLDQAETIAVPSALGGYGYGYYFWVYPEEGAFGADGHGGQFLLWFPDKDLLVVQVARPDGDLHGSQPQDVLSLVRPLWE